MARKKQKTWPIRYQTITVRVPSETPIRKRVCEACGRSVDKGEIKRTHLHHWVYAYKTDTIRENPKLALDNCVELCYGCHQMADALRAILDRREESFWKTVKVAQTMTPKQREKLDALVKLWKENNKDKKSKLTEFL